MLSQEQWQPHEFAPYQIPLLRFVSFANMIVFLRKVPITIVW